MTLLFCTYHKDARVACGVVVLLLQVTGFAKSTESNHVAIIVMGIIYMIFLCNQINNTDE